MRLQTVSSSSGRSSVQAGFWKIARGTKWIAMTMHTVMRMIGGDPNLGSSKQKPPLMLPDVLKALEALHGTTGYQSRIAAMIALAWTFALRSGELSELTWGDINFLCPPPNARGKKPRGLCLSVRQSKTGGDTHTSTAYKHDGNVDAFTFLVQLGSKQGVFETEAPWKVHEKFKGNLVFCGMSGEEEFLVSKPMDAAEMTTDLRAALDYVGVESEKFSMQSLRTGRATQTYLEQVHARGEHVAGAVVEHAQLLGRWCSSR
eukprot:TRINITY_DN17394_c0_g2_i1.p1 TRINITY_DN17394_c0_g2~~TRINITY_DN17394_c0_g2_i1.p1  ORF type:complete len:260 (+),score=16.36 TRINITY_DN17394_c0_g2_i1:119-898(+)